MSYKVEGVCALLSFLIGAVDKGGFAKDDSLLLPCLLVLGGGTLLSIPKDWKDVESDRESKIPTYYVVMANRGRSVNTSHKVIVACTTLGMIVPTIAFIINDGVRLIYCLMSVLAVVPGFILLKAERKKSVLGMLISLTIYIAVLAVAIRYFRSGVYI